MTVEEYYGRESTPHEDPPAFRTPAQRDHDRVLYSSAFGRLGAITQVATPEKGHQFHTRLTHTLKVDQVAVRMTQRLLREGLPADALDVDVVSTAALAHDIGHPPFGHVAEAVLNALTDECGGFEGNAQSFRIVTKLAVNKPDQWGLGLTTQSLNGMLKYPWLRGGNADYPDKWGAYGSEEDQFIKARHGHPASKLSLEAQLMDWADDVTFAVHDLEDFYRAGLIPLDTVSTNSRERERFRAHFFEDRDPEQGLRDRFTREGLTEPALDEALAVLFDDLLADVESFSGTRDDRSQVRRTSSTLISTYDRGVTFNVGDHDAVSLAIPADLRAQVAVLKALTWYYVIDRPSLTVIQEGQRAIIESLFDKYAKAAEVEAQRVIFPGLERDLLNRTANSEERIRVVADFLSGLTETMVYELHHRLTGISTGSILDSAARATR